MDQYEKNRIQKPIGALASADGDSLRFSQQIFAQLIANENQEEAVQYAIEVFVGINPPQRIQLLREIQLHLAQDRYPCLAFENNGRFFDHLMERLADEMASSEEIADETIWRWFRRIRSEIRRAPVHGKPEHIQEITDLIRDIRGAARRVSIEETTLEVSPVFEVFLGTLTDDELGRIIMFIRNIRDVRACRDRFNEVADDRYIAQQLGLQPSDLEWLGFPNLSKDFYAFLRLAPEIVSEIAAMDFIQLTLLMEHLSDFRSRKFQQGRVNER